MERIADYNFAYNTVYVFSDSSNIDSIDTCILGVYYERLNGYIILEIMSRGYSHFESWYTLPEHYCYVREADHTEIRNFSLNEGYHTLVESH